MKWFSVAHGAVLSVLALQRATVLDSGSADVVIELIVSAAVIFGYLWSTADGAAVRPVEPLVTLFGFRRKTPQISPPAYEEQIRKAAAQEERNRLARDLHDSIKQQLFVIQTAAATAQTRYEDDRTGAREALDRVRVSAREAITEMEVMLEQLRAVPLENVGLAEALKKHCEALRHRTGAHVRFELGSLPDSANLPPGTHEALYRVAQEALANVARHSRATKVFVSLGVVKRALQLSVEDDGYGFDPEALRRGMGLRNMRTRMEELGGELELSSKPGAGVLVVARAPVFEGLPAREYLKRAAMWFVLFALWVKMFSANPSVLRGVMMTLAAIATGREALAYARARKVAA